MMKAIRRWGGLVAAGILWVGAAHGHVTDAGSPTSATDRQKEFEAAALAAENAALAAENTARQLAADPGKVKAPKEFVFEGGQLSEFVGKIRDDFGINLHVTATIPASMLHTVWVPKMRLKYTPPWYFDGGKKVSAPVSPNEGLKFTQPLQLYNQVSAEADAKMGKWLIKEVQDEEPGLVMLVPPPQKVDDASFQVKAFSVPGWNVEDVNTITLLIQQESDRLSFRVREGVVTGLSEADIRGDLQYHKEAGILVVTGGRVYAELAGAIIQAAKSKVQLADILVPGRPAPKPSTAPSPESKQPN